jgi:hypothetical protein
VAPPEPFLQTRKGIVTELATRAMVVSRDFLGLTLTSSLAMKDRAGGEEMLKCTFFRHLELLIALLDGRC